MSESNPGKTITFISRTAPYGQEQPQLCLDMALASAVFDQQVNYVFLEDGVFQLLSSQNAESSNSKTIGNALETLDLYGIKNIFVDEISLSQRNLQQSDLIIDAKIVPRSTISELIDRSNTVFNL